jgi:Flp pilus assembly pilin Flp
MNSFINFVQDEDGAVGGAEMALLALVGLGLILFVVKKIKEGADTGAGNAAKALSTQETGGPATF